MAAPADYARQTPSRRFGPRGRRRTARLPAGPAPAELQATGPAPAGKAPARLGVTWPAGPVLAAIALLGSGLLVSGCSSAGHPGALSSSASRLGASESPHVPQYLPHSPPARGHSTQAAAAGPTTGPVTEPATAGPAACAVSALRITIGIANGAAGSIYYPLDFTNISGLTCTLYGYPGVAFATGADGSVVGVPAARNQTFARHLVTLTPGATAHASLQVQVAQSYPVSICKPATAHWLQVFPPASYVAQYIPFTAVTCTGHIPSGSTLGIYVIRPGATGP